MSPVGSLAKSQSMRVTVGQTDGRTELRLPRPRLHSSRGKNVTREFQQWKRLGESLTKSWLLTASESVSHMSEFKHAYYRQLFALLCQPIATFIPCLPNFV